MQAVFPNQTKFRRICRHMLFFKKRLSLYKPVTGCWTKCLSQAGSQYRSPWSGSLRSGPARGRRRRNGSCGQRLAYMHISIQTFAKITMILIIAHNNSLAFFIFLRVFLFLALLYAMTSPIKLPYKDKTILLNNRSCKIYCLKK